MSPEPDGGSEAMRRLGDYLASLRRDPPAAGLELVPRIVRRARWQRAVRAPLRAAGTLVGALADGVAAFFGPGTDRRR